jgi:hypothetical protein
VLECLPSKLETLSSNPSTTKKKKDDEVLAEYGDVRNQRTVVNTQMRKVRKVPSLKNNYQEAMR